MTMYDEHHEIYFEYDKEDLKNGGIDVILSDVFDELKKDILSNLKG